MEDKELVDVVDESGNLVEVVLKQEAHKQGLLHKTVISEVIDSQGRWLLVKQASDRQDAGQYVSPVGGHVMAGETEEDAVKREANEELGLTGEFKYEYVDRAIYNRNIIGRQENHFFIMYKIYSDAKPILNNESVSCRYFTEDELRKELKENRDQFGAAFVFVLERFFPHMMK
jgi:isopentenyl-diphosphate delta-isomerase